MRILLPVLVLMVVLFGSFPNAIADTFTIKFRVVDANGNPVADAELATNWVIDPAKNRFEGYSSNASTDASGMAEIAFQDYGFDRIVLCYNRDRSLAGYVMIERQKEGGTLEVQLKPVATVSATLTVSENHGVPEWTNTLFGVADLPGYFFEFHCSDGKLDFPFPEGKWTYRSHGEDVKTINGEFETVGGEAVAIGELDYELTPLARLEGKPVPKLEITEARGIDKDFAWSEYRGKWVLLEFWGFW